LGILRSRNPFFGLRAVFICNKSSVDDSQFFVGEGGQLNLQAREITDSTFRMGANSEITLTLETGADGFDFMIV
jgi:hypothetical protein